MTVTTHQVDVLFPGKWVIRHRTVRKVCVGDQSEFLEQLERAVHGRDVDARRGLADPRVHLLRSRVSEPVDRLEHELPLRGQPKSAFAQDVGEG